jgi:hypothetical protein
MSKMITKAATMAVLTLIATQAASARQPNNHALSDTYGSAPSWGRIYAPNSYHPGRTFSGGINSDFQLQRSN